jgi:hypothetical protein
VHVIVNFTFIVSEEFYMTRREPLVAFLKAYKRGTQCMLDHSDEAAQLEKVEHTFRELRLTKNTLRCSGCLPMSAYRRLEARGPSPGGSQSTGSLKELRQGSGRCLDIRGSEHT